jgi:hypothetical protein
MPEVAELLAVELLAEGLDLCVRARKLDEVSSNFERDRDGMFNLTRCGTPHLWVLDQYDRDLADWERRARNALTAMGHCT